jgi:hypothetical protein
MVPPPAQPRFADSCLSIGRIQHNQCETGKAFSDLLLHAVNNGESLMEASHVHSLEIKHAGLDRLIEEETRRPAPDASRIAQLKKEKLKIKDTLQLH